MPYADYQRTVAAAKASYARLVAATTPQERTGGAPEVGERIERKLEPLQTIEELGIGPQTPYPSKED